VHLSDVLALPFGAASAIRHQRVFHPNGVLASGVIERVAPLGEGLPVMSCDAIGRVSKAIGLPGAAPDIVGLAWRTPPQQPSASPWDVLLASTGGGGVGRVLLRPVTSWPGVVLTTLMPLGYQGGVWWLRARLVTNLVTPELSMAAVTNQFECGGFEFDIEQAAGTGEFHQLARLRLTEVVPGRDMAFDPTLNTAPGVQLLPRWLTDFRRAAYRRSRQGRHAE
jgi:hypothetical protein